MRRLVWLHLLLKLRHLRTASILKQMYTFIDD
jgi:hypothetical protein